MSSKLSWRKSAVKDVRPFFGAATLESSLQAAEIRLFEEATYSHEVSFVVEPQDVEKLHVSIKPNFDVSTLAASELKKGDLLIAITAAQPFVKKTCVVTSFSLAGKLPDEIVIGDEILAQLGGGGDVNVDVVLCLAKGLPKKAGIPFASISLTRTF